MTLQRLNKEIVVIELSGGKFLNGSVVDSSSELFVLYDGNKFFYLPFEHIHSLKIDVDNENNIQQPSQIPTLISKGHQDLTLKNILSLAKGIHVEIMVVRNEALHGMITEVMDDYFVFESPIYKKMLILNKHLKWLIPYFNNEFPYGLGEQEFLSLSSHTHAYKNTFASQIAELKNQLVVINLERDFSHIGKLQNINDSIIVMLNGKSEVTYFNLSHIQTLHAV